jgi:pilus assembly protein Flp/PilA
MNAVRQFIREEDGQDVVEYGLLIATIAIVVLVGISVFGNNISAWFTTLAKRITTNS